MKPLGKLAAVLAFLVTAGCLQATAPSASCGATDSCTPDHKIIDLPPTLHWESCTGFVANADLPRSTVQEMLPRGFEPRAHNALTAPVQLLDLDCARLLSDDVFLPGAASFHFSIPVLRTGQEPASDPEFFIFDVATSSTASEAIARAYGLHASAMERTEESTKLSATPEVRAVGYQRIDAALEFEYVVSSESPLQQETASRRYHWVVDGGDIDSARVEMEYRYAGLPQQLGRLTATGSLVLAQHHEGACCVPWAGQALMAMEQTWFPTDSNQQS